MKYKKWMPFVFLMWGLLSLPYCGGGISTADPNPFAEGPVGDVSPTPKFGSVTTQALNLGGLFPADIDIVNQTDLKDVLFITLTNPGAVLAVDITKTGLKVSTSYKGLLSLPGGLGIPKSLFVKDSAHAFLLSSDPNSGLGSVIYFNPKSSVIYSTLRLTDALFLTSPLAQVDANGRALANISGSFTPTLPADIAVVGSRLIISFSNIVGDQHWVQGLVRFYDIFSTSLRANPVSYTATSGFNATGLTPLSNGTLLVTSTGATRIQGRSQAPLSPGAVDVLNPSTGRILETLDLDMTAPAYRAWALTPDEKNAYIGSATGGYVLQIRLNPLSLVRGESNPIVITSKLNETDFIQDVVMGRDGGGIFPMSYNHNSVYAVDLTAARPTLLSDSVDLSFPGTPSQTVTGAGPGVLRPGTPGTDFVGPDLFVLTDNPGTVAAIRTY